MKSGNDVSRGNFDTHKNDPTQVELPSQPPKVTTLRSGRTLAEVRAQLSGLHFAKEALSDGERDILRLAEDLLDLIDSQAPNGFAR